MTIEYVKGDLINTECKYILHGCNAQGVMNSGVAAKIRLHYPQAYIEYRRAYESALNKHLSSLPLGSIIKVSSNDKVILNAVTQKYYGRDGSRYVSYDAIAEVFAQIERLKIKEIAMPKIGAGLGGGDWSVIYSIIESELKTTRVKVYIL